MTMPKAVTKEANSIVKVQGMKDLENYNAFGIITISRSRVIVNITAAFKGGHAFSRSIIEDLENDLSELTEDETGTLVFGAFLQEGKHTKVTFHEIGQVASKASLGDIAEVGKVLAKSFTMIRQLASSR